MKTIGEILEKNNSIFTKLIKKTQDTKSLAAVFQSVLDENLTKYCQFAKLEDSVITIAVKNAAQATRIRYAIPDMLKILRTQPEFKKIASIRYFVGQHPISATTPKKKIIKLSNANEVLWQETLAKLQKKARVTSKLQPPHAAE
jgi:hypothetical protein